MASGGGAGPTSGSRSRPVLSASRSWCPRSPECGLVGCAALAATATGRFASVQAASSAFVAYEREVLPVPLWAETYARMQPMFETLYGRRRALYDDLDALSKPAHRGEGTTTSWGQPHSLRLSFRMPAVRNNSFARQRRTRLGCARTPQQHSPPIPGEFQMTALAHRDWVPAHSERFVQRLARDMSGREAREIAAAIDRGIALNKAIHERDCVNLNPATNVMNPRAEALLGLGPRRAPLARLSGRQVRDGARGDRADRGHRRRAGGRGFRRGAMPRFASAPAHSPTFMPSWRRPSPVDTIIAPPPAIGGHVTHHAPGAPACTASRPTPPRSTPRLHGRPRRVARAGALGPPEADHDRRQPQPVPASRSPRFAPSPTRSARMCCSTPRTCPA